jgi:hypothetical protein
MSSNLVDVAFWASVICCALAQVMIIRSTFRSTQGGARTRASELLWVTLPGIALILVFALTWSDIRASANDSTIAAGEVVS